VPASALVVEDEFLVAMEFVAIRKDMGWNVSEPAGAPAGAVIDSR